MECIDPIRAHKEFWSGRNQMNPFHLLHLHEIRTDIRGFEIGVYFRYDCVSRKSTVICVNFHSRSSEPVEHVQHRILHALDAGGTPMIDRNPFWVHLVYVSLVLQWWKGAILHFAEELIAHVITHPLICNTKRC